MFNPNREIQSQGEKKSLRVTRRNFLKGAVLAGVGVLAGKTIIDLTANLWQPEAAALGIDILENTGMLELAIGNYANLLEKQALWDRRAEGAPKIERNPSYRPMTQIIGKVLDQRRNEGKPVVYQRVAGYEDLSYYLNKIRIAARDPANRTGSPSSAILGYIPGALESATIYSRGFFPEDVQPAWNMSKSVIGSSLDLVTPGSGFSRQTIERLGEESSILLGFSDQGDPKYPQVKNYWQTHKDEIDQVARKYLQDIKQHVETLVTQTGAPISAGEIFSYCMDRNNGGVDRGLMDTTIFLKYMARNDTTLSTFAWVQEPDSGKLTDNEIWFKEKIRDENETVGSYETLTAKRYQCNGLLPASYGKFDKDYWLFNLIGTPYHAWNIATLLSALPPTIVQMGVVGREEITSDPLGPVRTAADLRVALEARNLDSLFMKYS